eukprot:TRINITY_DN1348_c0_g1_i1.p1 TRINITY_DN1348_c0_g1~~TRINITY_DN1348_c0_g1_i1.p1  ORF type:complete len:541 (-),score=118.58 TRINITY_DN1348_c0_g1_i1:635-2257(-)
MNRNTNYYFNRNTKDAEIIQKKGVVIYKDNACDIVIKSDKIIIKQINPSIFANFAKVETVIPMDIILGVEQNKFFNRRFGIHAYPKNPTSLKRYQEIYEIECKDKDECLEWSRAIENCAREGDVDIDARIPNLLFIVNPFSGTKKALTIFETKVRPLLEISKVRYEKFETQYAGHAAKHASTLELDKFDALITISGDGLFYEMLNGLLSRKDWEIAIKIPIAVIPGGSGNALATAMVGVLDPLTSAFNVIKGMAKAFDIGSILQRDRRTFFFLSFSWGIVADVDFDSEKLRWMGSPRFTVTAIQKIANLKLYKGKLEYIPVQDWKPEKENLCDVNCNICLESPQQVLSLYQNSINEESEDEEEKSDNNNNFKSKINEEIREEIKQEEKNGDSPIDYSVDYDHGPEFNYIGNNPLEKDEEWVSMENDDFISVSVGNVTHIAHDMKSTPYSHWSDGLLDLTIARNMKRTQAISMFTKIEKGEHVGHEGVLYTKVKAIKLYPDQDQFGYLDVDGEKLPFYEPLSIELHRGLANLILPIFCQNS